MSFYRIADLLVETEFNFDLTRDISAPYLTDEGVPDISFAVSKEQCVAYAEKFKIPEQADRFEYMMSGTEFYNNLLNFNGMMLHASGVVVENRAYLFSAKSGTGKSTHTSLWLKKFGDKAFIINDDKPAVRYIDGKVFVYGTPFSGKNNLNSNARAELAGICFIERAQENSIEEIPPGVSIPLMLEQTQRKREYKHMDKLLYVMDKILSSTKVYKLRCNMDISAADLSYKVMSEGAIK